MTGAAIEEVFDEIKSERSALASYVSATGSAGTIAAGDYLRTKFPNIKVVASEALQCPTLLLNGFGGHRIEGIGDKHVPWIHNVKNTDVVIAVDDNPCMRLLRLFNEDAGKARLKSEGIAPEIVNDLHLFGISSIANVIAAIKTAKYYELTSDDVIFTVATDSADLYQSRLAELRDEHGEYVDEDAVRDFEGCLQCVATDYMQELNYLDKRRIHNLKYFTWIEQQAKELGDLNQLWYDREIWEKIFAQPARWDELINEFNDMTGLLKG